MSLDSFLKKVYEAAQSELSSDNPCYANFSFTILTNSGMNLYVSGSK